MTRCAFRGASGREKLRDCILFVGRHSARRSAIALRHTGGMHHAAFRMSARGAASIKASIDAAVTTVRPAILRPSSWPAAMSL